MRERKTDIEKIDNQREGRKDGKEDGGGVGGTCEMKI